MMPTLSCPPRPSRPSRPSRPVLRYHGGKYRLAPWILQHFPAHRVYVEPYMGACSVLLAKARSYAEVVNDLDGDVVNLFRVLRDPASAKDLQNLLRLTPFARAEFEAARAEALDPIERARRMIVRSFMGHGSAASMRTYNTGFRNNTTRSGTTPAHDWRGYPDALPAFVERLRGVVIENRPALDVLQKFDGRETLHYVDPPYPHETRNFKRGESAQVYRHEMSNDDHHALEATLRGLQGMVVLSGYPCDLYDVELFPDWTRVTRSTHADGARDRVEVLWLNPAASAALGGQVEMVWDSTSEKAKEN